MRKRKRRKEKHHPDILDILLSVVSLNVGATILSQIGNPYVILNDMNEIDLIENAEGILMQIIGERYENRYARIFNKKGM